MKKLTLLILLVSLTAKAVMFGPMPVVVPSSSLPIYTQMQDWYRMIGVNTNNSPRTNFTISWFSFQNEVSLALLTNSSFNSNIVQIVSTNASAISNIAAILGTNSDNTAIQDGYIITPAATGTSNLYNLDFGKTNSRGEHLIYAHLTATNDSRFLAPTNCRLWSLLSVDVLASGNQTIFLPTNVFLTTNGANLLTTNGLTLSNSWWSFILSNNQIFRFTMQSNPAGIEPQYTIKP